MIPDFPPMTPVEVYPLHPEEVLSEKHWWACSQPERPRGEYTAYDWRCRACVLAAVAHVKIQGDEKVLWSWTYDVEPEGVLLSWLVARFYHWNPE